MATVTNIPQVLQAARWVWEHAPEREAATDLQLGTAELELELEPEALGAVQTEQSRGRRGVFPPALLGHPHLQQDGLEN